MGSSSRPVKNKKKQHGGAHRTKRSDRANLRKAQAVRHVDKQVDDTEPIVENNGNNDVPENVLLNAEIDPVDIVPGSSVMHLDVSDEEMEVSAPCSDIMLQPKGSHVRRLTCRSHVRIVIQYQM